MWLFGLAALLTFTRRAGQLGIDHRSAGRLLSACCCCWKPACWACSAARDIILFYIFFEFTLIPLFFLIGIWGSEERRYAAIKFFLFTFAGSVLTFLGLLTIVHLAILFVADARIDVFDFAAHRRAGRSIRCRTTRRTAICNWWCSWRCSPGLRSRCRCFRCTPGCRWRIRKRRRREACCWPACC